MSGKLADRWAANPVLMNSLVLAFVAIVNVAVGVALYAMAQTLEQTIYACTHLGAGLIGCMMSIAVSTIWVMRR